jgi:hypothetical protein
VNLEPTHLQLSFIASAAKETLYGGARGGGKTFAVVLDWLVHSEGFGRLAKGIVFRRTLVELDDFIEKSKDILIAAGHSWMEGKKQFISPKGAILRCRYLDNDNDAALYQGHEYTRVYVEEIGNFPNESPVRKLLSTLRSGHGVPCQLKATANPGGAGHTWVKARYIDPAAAMTPFSQDGGKTYRVYIPAKLTDNPHLMKNDPEYIEMIRQAGNDELVKAWLDGDWDVVVGQYFKEFRRDKHVIPTAKLPDSWTVRYRSHDWGSARPFANYWQAVADGQPIPGVDRIIPRGALVLYRELYGWNGTPNQGCRWTSGQVGAAIVKAESEGVNEDRRIITDNNGLHKIDPATFATNGGPSIAEEMAKVGAWFTRADNRRVAGTGALGGWDQVRKRLIGEEDNPMIFFMDCCTHLLRTLPVLPCDSVMLDDIDTAAEDHAADAVRYGCMARPYSPPLPYVKPESAIKTLGDLTMEEAWMCANSYQSSVISRA